MRTKIIYIVSDSFSGSTILGYLIGTSREVFNCGELTFFQTDGPYDCSCGKGFGSCNFWDNIREKCKNFDSNSSLYYLYELIFEQACNISDFKYIMDVSKSLTRLQKLLENSSFDVSVVYINRNLRGLINSYKRHRDECHLLKSVYQHLQIKKGIDLFLLKSGLKFIEIEYYDLCFKPIEVIRSVNSFFGINIPADYINNIKTSSQHVFAGNVSVRYNIKKFAGFNYDDTYEYLNKIEVFIGKIFEMLMKSKLWILYRNAHPFKIIRKFLGRDIVL